MLLQCSCLAGPAWTLNAVTLEVTPHFRFPQGMLKMFVIMQTTLVVAVKSNVALVFERNASDLLRDQGSHQPTTRSK